MAPSTKRGKIKAQVFGDVSGVVVSIITKAGQTLGFIRNTTTMINNAVDGGGVSDETEDGGGGFSPPPDDNNDG